MAAPKPTRAAIQRRVKSINFNDNAKLDTRRVSTGNGATLAGMLNRKGRTYNREAPQGLYWLSTDYDKFKQARNRNKSRTGAADLYRGYTAKR